MFSLQAGSGIIHKGRQPHGRDMPGYHNDHPIQSDTGTGSSRHRIERFSFGEPEIGYTGALLRLSPESALIRNPWLICVAVPCAINLALVGMYFSGIPFLQHIIVPNMPNAAQAREFGLLENLQNMYLLAMTCMGIWAIKVKPYLLEKIVAILFTIFAAFIFLEEIDYGLHWQEYLAGVAYEDAAEVRNWHNEGQRTSIMKDVVTATTVLIFVIAPFALAKVKIALVTYVLPAKQYAAGFLGIVLISRLAHYLNDLELGVPGITQNIGEFRELGMYYFYMVHTWTVVFRRSYGTDPAAPQH